jgi:hypothetical protein
MNAQYREPDALLVLSTGVIVRLARDIYAEAGSGVLAGTVMRGARCECASADNMRQVIDKNVPNRKGETDRELLLARPYALSAARARENWFSLLLIPEPTLSGGKVGRQGLSFVSLALNGLL